MCGNGLTRDDNNAETPLDPVPQNPSSLKSAREILDAYDRRMYEKYKEKYENGIFTR